MKLLYAFTAIVACSMATQATSAQAQLVPRTPIFVGNGPQNNGVATNNPQHLNGTTTPIGCTIDEGSAQPRGNFVRVYAGNGTVNNKVLSNYERHLNSSTEVIGVLSKSAVTGGTLLYRGTGALNNGVLSSNSGHLGDLSEEYGWSMPCKS